MKTFFFLCSVCFFLVHGNADEFVIRYQPLTSGSIFHVESAWGIKVGKVVRTAQAERVLYSLFNTEQELIASGTTEKLATNTVVSLTDSKGLAIGSFSAQIYNLYPTEYNIFAPNQQWLAKGVMNWLSNSFTLASPHQAKHYLVTFLRPRFKLFNDHWHFQIHEEGAIDFRLLCILGTFQTACDLIFDEL